MAVRGLPVYPWILSFLRHPYCEVAPTHCGFYVTGPLDGLALRVKIAAYGGIFLASPVLAVGVLAVHHPRPQSEREALRHPLHRGHHRTVHARRRGRLRDLPARAWQWLDSIGGPSLTQILDPIKYLNLITLLMVAFG